MPEIRSETGQESANQEGNFLLAPGDLKKGRIQSLRAAAKVYERSTACYTTSLRPGTPFTRLYAPK